jgi:hypothetical protein
LVVNKKHQLFIALLIGISFSANILMPDLVWSQEKLEDRTEVSFNVVEPVLASAVVKLPKMAVQRTQETGDASLSIEAKEVLKIRSSAGGFSPIARAQLVADRINTFLRKGGNPRDIKPGLEGQEVVIRAGQVVLVTVDAETAKKSNIDARQLAIHWTNLIRLGLGVPAMERNPNLIASRSFSPLLTQLRQIPASGMLLKGSASWYGPGFHGRRTASGQRFDMNALTAAHKTLPLNTIVRVTNNRNGLSAIVRITDRGPFIPGRIIDLSKGAAQAVGMLSSGTAPVTVEVLGR